MAFEHDEETLQDFLVEASEILDQLQRQLVELENSPEDKELLNSIFRGFHTIKGGAGFLSLDSMVATCHEAENTFDLLRTAKISLTHEIMDTIFQILDLLNNMCSDLQAHKKLTPIHKELLAKLKNSDVQLKPDEAVLIDNLLQESKELSTDSLPSSLSEKEISNSADLIADKTIDDNEFEQLLDELYGKGKFGAGKLNSNTQQDIDKKVGVRLKSDDEKQLFEVESEINGEDLSDLEFDEILEKLGSKSKSIEKIKPKIKPVSSIAVPPKLSIEPLPLIEETKLEAYAEKIQSTSKPNINRVEATVRVETSRLDDIMNMVGELVLVRNRLTSLGINTNDEEMLKSLFSLDAITSSLQGAVMKTRMQPIKKVFGRFPRVVRDLSRQLNKEIALKLEGEDTDLDKNLVEALADPLVHLVRNAVDHGIETPEVRIANGKTAVGTITLRASQEGDHVLLKIQDDGAGMDPEKLKSVAITRGILDKDLALKMSDQEAYHLILAAGFTTKTEASDISGRGVGMDVVKTRIAQLNGTILIDSSKGNGSSFTIKVPLTLAIIPTLMIKLGEQTFALPTAIVKEIFNLDLTKTHSVDGQLTVIIRDKALPLFYLDRWLTKNCVSPIKNSYHVVVVQVESIQVGLVVDTLIGQEEVIIKPLGSLLQHTAGMAGATITSDGKIALILDVPGLIKRYAKHKPHNVGDE